MPAPLRPSSPTSAAVCALLLCSGLAWAQKAQRPTAAVVLLGESALTAREVGALLNSAIDEVKASSGYELDAVRSLQAGDEAVSLECDLNYDCLLRVSDATEVDAILALRALPEGRRSLQLELLWVAADARGTPGMSEKMIPRTAQALERAVRAGVRKVIPDYARTGKGGLMVLAESGSDIVVDGQASGTAPLERPLILSAGVHRVDVVTPRRIRVTRMVEVVEARRQVVDMPAPTEAIRALAPQDPPSGGKALRTASFVVGGAGVLAVAGGLYFGMQANALNGQVARGACSEVPCTAGLTQREAHALFETASGHATLGNVGLTSGLLMAAGAGVMYWLSRDDADPEEAR